MHVTVAMADTLFMQATDDAGRKKRTEDLAELKRQLTEGASCGSKDEVSGHDQLLRYSVEIKSYWIMILLCNSYWLVAM